MRAEAAGVPFCSLYAECQFTALLLAAFALVSVGCSSGGGEGGRSAPATYTVGGTLSDLGAGKTVVLRESASNKTKTLNSNGAFTFDGTFINGASTIVTVQTQPAGQTCAVTNGTQTISGSNVTNVVASCHDSGSLDASFGTGGKVTTDSGDNWANALVIQTDGKLVAAGYSNNVFGLWRYSPDGSLDSSFGTGGQVTTDLGNSGLAVAKALVVQSNAKIVVAGSAGADFGLARYNPDGSLDQNFGTDGRVITDIEGGSIDIASAIAFQSDGKLVVGGTSINGTNYNLALVRYSPDGSLDSSFGTGGRVITAIGGTTGGISALAIQSDGKIVVVGSSAIGTNGNFALWRYNSDGSLDSSFELDGQVTTDVGNGSSDGASALALQSDGKLVVAGVSWSGTNWDFALVRYNPDGNLDQTFGTGGQVTTAIGPSTDYSNAVVIQSDGKLVVAGSSSNGANDDVALVRYNPDGSLDQTFGTGGQVTTGIGSNTDYASAIVIQSDGKFVAAGLSLNGANVDTALVRYWP